MNQLLKNYLEKQGFSVVYIDYKAMGENRGNVYNAWTKDYTRFVFVKWEERNYPNVKIYVCDNASTENSREYISCVSLQKEDTIKMFVKALKDGYIKKYGYLRWFFRPIMKPFFQYMKTSQTDLALY